MGLSKITVNVGEGGLGRRPVNKDKISGIIFFNDSPPPGFASTPVRKVYTLAQAEAQGLTVDASGSEVEYYHVKEFFRMNPEGELWIGYYDVPSTYDFSEITDFVSKTSSEVRLLGIYAPAHDFASGDATAIKTIIDAIPDQQAKTLSVLYAANFSTLSALSDLSDLRTLSSRQVSVIFSQDGGNRGAELFTSKSYSITTLGAHLGAVSSAPVHESVAYARNYNFSDGDELEVLAYADGTLIDGDASNAAIPLTQQGAIKDKGYAILRKHTGYSGSYAERVPCCVAATSDFAFLANNRVMAKAIRGVLVALTPELNRPVETLSDGTLPSQVIGYFTDVASTPLESMQAEGNISAPEEAGEDGFSVTINPNQDFQSTSTVEMTIDLLPIGAAEFITLNIGLTSNL